ncbi:hypothetical protein ACXJY6_11105 [Vibrio sp. RC27]
MFNKYYVFVPSELDTAQAPLSNATTISDEELKRRRLVAEAQVILRECPKSEVAEPAYKKCA